MTLDGLATRWPVRLRPDPSRVVAQLFVPGHALPCVSEGRASSVVGRILDLGDDEVTAALAVVIEHFAGRHRDLAETFERHADRIRNRIDPGVSLSAERWRLLGATFTAEYAVEAAALCNPSAVAHPDQSGVPAGSLRFLMSVRQIGEGHRSSVGFRTGLVDERGSVTVDDPGPFTTAGTIGPATLREDGFRGPAERPFDDAENTDWVLDRLGSRFTPSELEFQLGQLEAQHDTRRNVTETVKRLRHLAARSYKAEFEPTSDLGERVLYPATAVEINGIEDARFVRFVDDDGTVTYYGTCTAFDGTAVVQELFATEDFASFDVSPLLGAGATNKGLALFPRRINGRYHALSRHDGASNGIASSDDIRRWPTVTQLDCPAVVWEALQVGNCGPPIETDHGWLVLTHGVGPMRTYSIGALLLDLDEPTKVVGRLRTPILTPQPGEQDGYVPNVLYSCGALLHGPNLLIPFGIGDSTIGFATFALADLVAAMQDDLAVTQP